MDLWYLAIGSYNLSNHSWSKLIPWSKVPTKFKSFITKRGCFILKHDPLEPIKVAELTNVGCLPRHHYYGDFLSFLSSLACLSVAFDQEMEEFNCFKGYEALLIYDGTFHFSSLDCHKFMYEACHPWWILLKETHEHHPWNKWERLSTSKIYCKHLCELEVLSRLYTDKHHVRKCRMS